MKIKSLFGYIIDIGKQYMLIPYSVMLSNPNLVLHIGY
jgi:hypothetical protein